MPSVVPVGPATGLLTEDSEAPTQQSALPASFFAPQDQYTSPTIIHDPFPPAGTGSAGSTGGDPLPPTQENPFPKR